VRARRARWCSLPCIIDAARELLLTGGYTGTTIQAIANAAGVSVQTVYNSVGNKAAVLTAVYDTTLAGDDSAVTIADRPTFQAVLDATSARACLARYAARGRELGERAVPLVAMIVPEAGTPDVRPWPSGPRTSGPSVQRPSLATWPTASGWRPG
jgi:AcrR family transcriptional regulator